MSVLRQILSSSPYLRSAMERFPLGNKLLQIQGKSYPNNMLIFVIKNSEKKVIKHFFFKLTDIFLESVLSPLSII